MTDSDDDELLKAAAENLIKAFPNPWVTLGILRELLHDIDVAFEQKSGELPATPQTEQVRYAKAMFALGRFLSKADRTHADRFFVLGDALADLSVGRRPLLLKSPKLGSAANPTQIETAKAAVAFALEALIALGDSPENAAKTLLDDFSDIKNLAGPKTRGPKSRGVGPKTILEWRKFLRSPSRKRNALAVEVFEVGHPVIERYIKEGRQAELKARALDRARYANRVGKFAVYL
jgi:hypothetical protein